MNLDFRDYGLLLSLGIWAWIITAISIRIGPTQSLLEIIRIISVLLYGCFAIGYTVTTVLFPKSEQISFGERLCFSLGFSLLSWYPISFVNIFLIEGRQDIYQVHLLWEIIISLILLVILIGISILIRGKSGRNAPLFEVRIGEDVFKKREIYILGFFMLAFYLRFMHLGDPNLNGDEFEVAYRAYDLVDGMQAGRKAYFISATDHGPLGFYMWHFLAQAISPWGVYSLSEVTLRLPSVLLGMGILYITYTIGKKWFASAWISIGILMILAVDQYSILASKLVIHPDLAYFTLFLILAVQSLLRYWEAPKTRNLIVAGIFSGCVFLVKFSAVILIPFALAGFIVKRKNIPISKFLVWGSLVFLMFSPVVFFNVNTYIYAHYLDVPFSRVARLLGFKVDSLMLPENIYGTKLADPLTTFYELIWMLIDQWNVLLFSLGVFSICYVVTILFLKKLKSEYHFVLMMMLIWMASAVLFLSLNGFRIYYSAYLSIPLAIIISCSVIDLRERLQNKKIVRRAGAALLGIIFAYTFYYSYQTHFKISDWISQGERGRSGYSIILPSPLRQPYSISTLGFLTDRGWRELRRYVQQNVQDEDVLLFDSSMSDLSLRWYLHVGDEVRRFYIGEDYKDAYSFEYISSFEEKKINPKQGNIYLIFPLNKEANYIEATALADQQQKILAQNEQDGFGIYIFED